MHCQLNEEKSVLYDPSLAEPISRKAIRDGQEDLLYMAAAERVVGRDAVLRVIADVMTRGYAIADDPTLLARTREALGALAEGGAGSAS